MVPMVRATRARRVRSSATVVTGLVVSFLVLSAVPAAAVSTCSNAADPNILVVQVDVDDQVALRLAGGTFGFSVNGGAFSACGGSALDADVDWVQVSGTGAGRETFVLLEPGAILDVNDNNVTVDLGGGNDALVLEWGDAPGQPGSDPASSAGAVELGIAADGTLVGTANTGPCCGETYLRIDDAESITVNAQIGMFADSLDLDGDGGAAESAVNGAVPGTADNVPAMLSGEPFPMAVTFNGRDGDDTLVSGAGNDVFNAGAGADGVDYTGANGVTVDLAAGQGTGHGNDTLSDVQHAVGSPGVDTLLGNALSNTLSGRNGDDVLDGRDGDDTLNGNDGADDLTDGAGNDTSDGGPGDDVYRQGAAANGADTLADSGPGTDVNTYDYSLRTTRTILRENGDAGFDANGDGDATDPGDEGDTVGGNVDVFMTGSGNDVLVGAGGADTLLPGAGDDDVSGGGGVDLLDISAGGAATIDLQAGTATGEGTDTFDGTVEQFATGGADDVLIPADGSVLDPTSGSFDWFAGTGHDVVDASSTTVGVRADLSNMGGPSTCVKAASPSAAGAPGGTCTDVEDFIGGGGDDTAFGTIADNSLIGNDGHDTLVGGNGNDRFDGGLGNDSLDGNAGLDLVTYEASPGAVDVTNQSVFGGGASGAYGSDTFVTGFEHVVLSNFDDVLTGGQTSLDANMRVQGKLGNDVITGTNSVDVLSGGQGDDVLRGARGDDTIKASGGDDLLGGGQGSDLLNAGSGFDEAHGGRGFDRCTGAEIEVRC
jgi:Ca2+-binding RTX toxin-like protein